MHIASFTVHQQGMGPTIGGGSRRLRETRQAKWSSDTVAVWCATNSSWRFSDNSIEYNEAKTSTDGSKA